MRQTTRPGQDDLKHRENAVDQNSEHFENTASISEGESSAAPPPDSPANKMIGWQQTIGNHAARNRIARTPTPTIQRQDHHGGHHESRTPPPFDFSAFDIPRPPVESNWDVPAREGATDLAPGWNEQPDFPNGYLAHEATPELDRGKTRFQADWSQLAGSWNNAANLASRYNIRAMLPDVMVSSINGQPVPPPPMSLRAPDTERARPTGSQSIDSSFNPANQLDIQTPFNPASLRGADRALYDTKITAATTARNNRTAKEITVDTRITEVDNALSRVRQAQIRERQAQTGEQRTDAVAERGVIDRERQQIATIIGGAQSVLAAGVKRNAEAYAGAVTGVIGAMTTVYYNDQINQVEMRLAELDRTLARLQTSLAVEDVIQARNNVRIAINAVRSAITELDTAAQQERTAFNDLSQTIEQLARRQGMSADDARTVATAAAAIPMMDETIGNLSQIEAAIHIPTYTRDSGIGAGLIRNLDTFREHLAILKGFKNQVIQLKQQWITRRNSAQSGTGVPGQTTAPTAP
jgi:hypothetical protein